MTTASPPDTPVVLERRVVLPSSGATAVIISINRPDKLNCFNSAVCQQLSQRFGALNKSVADSDNTGGSHDDDDDTVAAVIFTGEGTSFCAGADLADPPSPLDQSSDLPKDLINNPVHHMQRLGVPIIAALKGYVVTGGFELALACDILVGDDTVVFRDTHCKFGLAPCWGLSQRLQRRVGAGRAKMASLGAIPVRAQQALEWGLLDDMAESSLDRALEIADAISKNDLTMMKRYKRAIDEGGRMTFGQGLWRERQLAMAHYLEIGQDGKTFAAMKEYITDDSRPRSKL